jgi:hypothetical protein
MADEQHINNAANALQTNTFMADDVPILPERVGVS